MRKLSDEKAALCGTLRCWEGGAGQTTLPYRVHAGGGLGLRYTVESSIGTGQY